MLSIDHKAPSPLEMALRSSTRTAFGERHPDPHAVAVLKSNQLPLIEEALASAGAHVTGPLSGGVSSVVLDADEFVVRLGNGTITPIHKSAHILQPTAQAQCGAIRVEVFPKADTNNITPDDVAIMKLALDQEGLEFSDPGTDNLGRYEGRLVVIDPGAYGRKHAIPDTNPVKQRNAAILASLQQVIVGREVNDRDVSA